MFESKSYKKNKTHDGVRVVVDRLRGAGSSQTAREQDLQEKRDVRRQMREWWWINREGQATARRLESKKNKKNKTCHGKCKSGGGSIERGRRPRVRPASFGLGMRMPSTRAGALFDVELEGIILECTEAMLATSSEGNGSKMMEKIKSHSI